MNKNKNQQAFTLIETLTYSMLLGILLIGAQSLYKSLFEYRIITSSASAIYQDLRIAKSEAIKRNSRIQITFKNNDAGIWCYGWKVNDACDCFAENSCTISGATLTKSHVELPRILLDLHLTSPGNRLVFDKTRMFVANTYGHIRIKTVNKEIRVIVSRTGRVRLCSPSGELHVIGYSTLCQ